MGHQSGYTNAGLLCGLNTPSVPAGYKGLTGLDIVKNSYGRGAGTIPTACNNGREYQTGLCYTPCKAGYDGNGPVCWNTCPKGYVQCGAGCATSAKHCAKVTADQVTSTLGLVVNAISLGSWYAARNTVQTAMTAKEAADAAKAAAKWYNQTIQAAKEATAAIKASEGFQKTVKAYDATKELRDAKKLYDKVDRVEKLSKASDAEHAARIMSGFDPSGISQVVNAFAQRICNEELP